MSAAENMVPAEQPVEVEPLPTSPVEADEQAEWKLRRIGGAQAEMARNAELAAREHAKIDKWLENANAPLQSQVEYLTSIIRQIAHAFPFEGKKKSRALISGTFGFRTKPAKLVIVDPAAALAEAKAKDIPVTVTEKVGVTALKEYWQSTGIVPAGTEVEPASETFYVEASK